MGNLPWYSQFITYKKIIEIKKKLKMIQIEQHK